MPKLKQSGSEHVKIALLAMVSDPQPSASHVFSSTGKMFGNGQIVAFWLSDFLEQPRAFSAVTGGLLRGSETHLSGLADSFP